MVLFGISPDRSFHILLACGHSFNIGMCALSLSSYAISDIRYTFLFLEFSALKDLYQILHSHFIHHIAIAGSEINASAVAFFAFYLQRLFWLG
jgi:hypothetical protein